jgi:hypothetical protein
MVPSYFDIIIIHSFFVIMDLWGSCFFRVKFYDVWPASGPPFQIILLFENNVSRLAKTTAKIKSSIDRCQQVSIFWDY